MNLLLQKLLFVILFANSIRTEICNKFKTCGECIGNPHSCVWCSSKTYKETRCHSRIIPLLKNETWCDDTVDPRPVKNIKIDNPFKSAENGERSNVQFKPQEIYVKARPGVAVHFEMSFKPAKDYPLDIYYLMDNSFTMHEHKKKLEAQAKNIYETLTNITNNVRFGVGSFVEKFALPFTSPIRHKNAYLFKNHLSLTENITEFEAVVRSIEDEGNFDTPEAGLDALMQVMVCPEINWRDDARRIVILSTDSTYHSAGDGKFVGAVTPNDMECHLKDNNYDLEASLKYDYPSVNQISKKANEKQISIIFAVLKEVKDVYVALSEKIQGAKYVEFSLKSDIALMIKSEYQALLQNLTIKRDSPPDIDIILDFPCTSKSPCGVKLGETVNIDAALTITSCPKDNKTIHVVNISPSGLNEKLIINIEVDCQCECEKEGKGEKDSHICRSTGIYQCGVCKCNVGSYGDNCECVGTSTKEIDLEKCKANTNDSRVCSGRGECSCGTCQNCQTNYYGKLCEFSIYDCKFYQNEPCGGQGRCENKTCICNDGWIGDACSCSVETNSCIGPNFKICSGNGECDCGKCKCTKLDSKMNNYTGLFCNYCADCDEERCKELSDYVECYYFNHKNSSDQTSCDNEFDNPNYNVTLLNRTEINDQKYRDTYRCKIILTDDSSIVFKYLDKDESTYILIQQEKEHLPEPNVWVAVGSAIGAILLIGLLTVLVWKILVDIHDAREYEKFAKQSAADGFDVSSNPLYQPPATCINNPVYDKNDY